MNSRRDSQRVGDAGALERAQLAAEPVLARQRVPVGGARAADGADRGVVLDRAAGSSASRALCADVDPVERG